MKRVQVVEIPSNAVDILADILHTHRKNVSDLASRKTHPLPLTMLVDEAHENALQQNYRDVLSRWISEERQMAGDAVTSELNLERIENELIQQPSKSAFSKDWTIDRCLECFPPGHFLG